MQNYGNIYALTDKLNPAQTLMFLELGIALCIVGFLFAEYNLLYRMSNRLAGLFAGKQRAAEPRADIVSRRA